MSSCICSFLKSGTVCLLLKSFSITLKTLETFTKSVESEFYRIHQHIWVLIKDMQLLINWLPIYIALCIFKKIKLSNHGQLVTTASYIGISQWPNSSHRYAALSRYFIVYDDAMRNKNVKFVQLKRCYFRQSWCIFSSRAQRNATQRKKVYCKSSLNKRGIIQKLWI